MGRFESPGFAAQQLQAQAPPLVLNKVEPPALQTKAVRRSHLIERLQAPGWSVAVVTGGAGTGKTVTVRQWLDVEPEGRWAWVSFDTGDSPPDRFWSYVLVALDRLAPDCFGEAAGSLLHEGPGAPAFLPTLLNEAQTIPEPVTLVLDDVHNLLNPATLDGMRRLVERLPAKLRIVAISRRDPAWPLARWRGSDHLIELRHRDLAFTPAECASLMAARGVDLSEIDLDALTARSEGWVAVLQLAVLAMRTQDPSSVVKRFEVGDEMVSDLISTELIASLSEEQRDFLLRTSVLDRLETGVCDVLTDRSDSARMLDSIAAELPFVDLLEGSGTTYRCHQLLVQALRAELRRSAPEQLQTLHRAAAAATAARGDLTGSIGHLLAAGDIDAAFGLTISQAFDRHDHGEIASVEAWVDAFPSEYLGTSSSRMIQFALAVAMCGRVGEALAWLDRAGRHLDDGSATSEVLALQIDGVRLLIYAIHGAGEGLAPGRRAVDADERGVALGSVGPRLRANLARVYLMEGRADEALEVIDGGPAGHDVAALVLVPATKARIAHRRGELNEAEALAAKALAGATAAGVPEHGATLEAHMALGGVFTDRRDFAAAESALEAAVELAERYRFPMVAVMARLDEVRIQAARNGPDAALHVVTELRAAIAGKPWVSLERLVDGLEARWLIEIGALSRAEPLVRRLPPTGVTRHLLEARLEFAHGRPQSALERIDALRTNNRRDQLTAELLRLRVLAEHDRSEPRDSTAAAVEFARGDGLVLPFHEEGATLTALAAELSATPLVLSRTRWADSRAMPEHTGGPPGHGLALSGREQAVLQLLPSRMTKQEIAGELFVSINTVKTHAKSLYRKLGVSSRSEAVEEARHLGLL